MRHLNRASHHDGMRNSIGLVLLLAIGLTAPAFAQNKQALATGEMLHAGEYLVSANRSYFAMQQVDGNFCVYRGSGPADNRGTLWCSMKTAGGGQFRAVMQPDGNFVVYAEGSTSALWATMAMSGGGAFVAVMQDDGNFAIYPGTGPSTGATAAVLWQSATGERTVTITPPTLGRVASSTGAVCPPQCSIPIRYGTNATLTANPDTPHRFVSWNGPCEGSASPSCTIQGVPTAPQVANAQIEERVTVTAVPPDAGMIQSTPAAIGCGGSTVCSVAVRKGTSMVFTTAGARLTQWLGDCSGTGNCTLVLDSDKVVGATVAAPALITAAPVGGTIESAPYSFSCPTKCSLRFPYDRTNVTLAAVPTDGYAFVRWLGDCAETGAIVQGNQCTIPMDIDHLVGAQFRRQ
jgi:hypothetical protein